MYQLFLIVQDNCIHKNETNRNKQQLKTPLWPPEPILSIDKVTQLDAKQGLM